MKAEQTRMLVAKKMSEKELLANVAKQARLFGWLFYHTHRSQFSEAGYPDCSMLLGKRHVVAELKRQSEKPTYAQETWLMAFDMAGAEAYVWRPSDWLDGTIERVLRG